MHGQLCITSLIEMMLREVDIPLQLQEIEGDALFLYAAHPGDAAGWRDVLSQVRVKLPRFFEVFASGATRDGVSDYSPRSSSKCGALPPRSVGRGG